MPLIVYSVVAVAAVCMLDARWGIVYCFVHLYLSLLFNLKLVDLCERGNYGGLCGVLTRVSLRGGLELMSN